MKSEMTSKRLYTMLVLLLVVGNVAGATSIRTADVSDEEDAVYAALLAHMFVDNGGLTVPAVIQELVIRDQTDQYSLEMIDDKFWLKDAFPQISPETINDYKLKNKVPYRLRDAFDLRVKHKLVASEQIEQIFKFGGEGWPQFFKKYPNSGGYVSLSRVGFNYDRNQALIFVSHSCGPQCGSGSYVFLLKSDNIWRVSKEAMVWIS